MTLTIVWCFGCGGSSGGGGEEDLKFNLDGRGQDLGGEDQRSDQLSPDGADVAVPDVQDAADTSAELHPDTEPQDVTGECGGISILTEKLDPSGIGEPYFAVLAAGGGVGTVSWGLEDPTKMPAGMGVTPAGVFQGTPVKAGEYEVPFKVYDQCVPPQKAVKTITFVVVGEPPDTLTWVEEGKLPYDLAGGGAGVVGGKACVAGGDTGVGKPTGKLLCYDKGSASWGELEPMATGRYSPGAAVLDGKLYVFGGYLQGVGQLASCEVYESGKGWSGCGALNTKRVGLRGAALGGKVYAVGGYDGSDKLKTMEVYDPATGQWSEAPDMPTARTAPAVAALDGKLYVAGGMDEAYLSALEIFDPATQQWSAGMPMPVKKGSAAAAAMPEKHVLLVIGGIGNTGPGEITSTDRVERYDPATGAWTVYPTGLPGFRGDLMAVYLPGGVPVVVALGGELNLDKKGETYLGYFDL